MRLRVIALPEQGDGKAPYMLLMDHVPDELTESMRDIMAGTNEAMTERTGGLCHGFLMVNGEVEVE